MVSCCTLAAKKSPSQKIFFSVRMKKFATVLGTARFIPTVNTEPAPPRTPPDFDGRRLWRGLLTPVQDQGNCGGCYAFATCAVLQDRFALFTNGLIRPQLDPLAALACQPPDLGQQELRLLRFDPELRAQAEQKTLREACTGGTLTQIPRFFYQSGARTTSCTETTSGTALPACSKDKICTLWPVRDMYRVSDSEDLDVLAVAMQQDICSHGPLLAGFFMYPDFLQFKGNGVYMPAPNQQRDETGHAIRVVGWGVESGVRYWLCLNSWSTHWGDHGACKLQMASEALQLERNSVGLIPQIPGILRFFHLVVTRRSLEQLRSADTAIRASTGVNPFTLLSRESTALCVEQGKNPPLIFHQLQYTPHGTLLACCSPGPERTRFVPFLAGSVLLTLLILLLLSLILLRRRR